MANLTLGQQVRTARETALLSRERLAAQCGCSTSTILRLELRGHTPSVRILVAIARVLHLDLGELTDSLAGSAA